MCEDCGGICAIFDQLLERLAMDTKTALRFSPGYRSKYHSTNVKGITGSDGYADSAGLAEFVEEAQCINMTPRELEVELIRRSGLGEAISLWIREKKIPSGVIRKLILTNAEDIIRERGAVPELSVELLEAA